MLLFPIWEKDEADSYKLWLVVKFEFHSLLHLIPLSSQNIMQCFLDNIYCLG